RSNGTPNVLVSVTQRPPTSPVASSTTNLRPFDAASLRAAAMPAAPAPTTTISTGPERGGPSCVVGAGVGRGAPSAGVAPLAAEAARNDRRVRRFIGTDAGGCFAAPCRNAARPAIGLAQHALTSRAAKCGGKSGQGQAASVSLCRAITVATSAEVRG